MNEEPRETSWGEALEMYFQRAQALLENQDLEAAGALLDELTSQTGFDAAELDPSAARTLIDLAGTLIPTARYDLLEDLFRRGIQALEATELAGDLDLIVPYFNRSVLYYAANREHDRSRALTALLELARTLNDIPGIKETTVLVHAGELFRNAGYLEEAMVFYEHVHRFWTRLENPEDAPGFRWALSYGHLAIQAAQFDRARQVYDDALERAGRLGEPGREWEIAFLGARGNLALTTKEPGTAEESLLRAVELAEASDSKSEAAGASYHNLASLYLMKRSAEDYPAARGYARRALSLVEEHGREGTSEHADGLALLGDVATRMGDHEEAEEYYRTCNEVLDVAPDAVPSRIAEYRTSLGFTCLRRQRPEESTRAFADALQVVESEPGGVGLSLEDALSNLATGHFEAGEYGPAAALYTRSCRLRLGTGDA